MMKRMYNPSITDDDDDEDNDVQQHSSTLHLLLIDVGLAPKRPPPLKEPPQ
jgi:hypothetical protein